MLIKDSRLSTNEDYHIKPLDLIRIHLDLSTPCDYMVVPGDIADQVHLLSMSDGFLYDHEVFNHPIHLHNHLLKHYGEYHLVKSKHLELNLKGPVQSITKGGRW
jgi:hypothetical protein